ncbi:MAG TPA: Txe/YoeB family addiction module toxin [Azospirillaceae bacterium]|nr:Txe/YoeB family addiction module toxin [Azospirillaceae bacterium]
MRVVFSADAWRDYLFWQEQNREIFARINELIEDARRHPFSGIGKPEPLRGEMKGFWSRRITLEHRLVYRVEGKGDDQRIEITGCRYHYQ